MRQHSFWADFLRKTGLITEYTKNQTFPLLGSAKYLTPLQKNF